MALNVRRVFSLFVVLVISYTMIWYFIESQIVRNVLDGLKRVQADVIYSRVEYSGFPFKFGVSFHNIKIKAKNVLEGSKILEIEGEGDFKINTNLLMSDLQLTLPKKLRIEIDNRDRLIAEAVNNSVMNLSMAFDSTFFFRKIGKDGDINQLINDHATYYKIEGSEPRKVEVYIARKKVAEINSKNMLYEVNLKTSNKDEGYAKTVNNFNIKGEPSLLTDNKYIIDIIREFNKTGGLNIELDYNFRFKKNNFDVKEGKVEKLKVSQNNLKLSATGSFKDQGKTPNINLQVEINNLDLLSKVIGKAVKFDDMIVESFLIACADSITEKGNNKIGKYKVVYNEKELLVGKFDKNALITYFSYLMKKIPTIKIPLPKDLPIQLPDIPLPFLKIK
ncbi:MAG: hypothetical protein J0H68_00680 [Sphingobacteriia bacterium]|nr:hypothetical protein [Sphingobacteriia bacterium]